MKQYNFRYCPVVKLTCGEVHVLNCDKGQKFLKWFLHIYKSNVYHPLKEKVWVVEYGRPDEIRKECIDAAIQSRGWKSINAFKDVYAKYLAHIGKA